VRLRSPVTINLACAELKNLSGRRLNEWNRAVVFKKKSSDSKTLFENKN